MNRYFSILILIVYSSIIAQAQRPLGTWRSFMPYTNALQVTQSDDRIYCASAYSILYVEKSDGSYYTLDKAKGLSDAGISRIAYHRAKNTLIIAYTSSNIDLLVNGTDIYNMPDVKNARVTSSKSINDIAIIGDYAYLATDIGISVLDLDKKEIKDNYIIGATGGSVVVTSIASDGINIYAATTEGLKSAPLSSPNLQDYSQWRVYGASDNLPTGVVSFVGQEANKLYVVLQDSLFVYNGTSFSNLMNAKPYTCQSMTNSGGYLYAVFNNGDIGGGKILKIKPDGGVDGLTFDKSYRPIQIVNSGSQNWIADEWDGLLKYDGMNFNTKIVPNCIPSISNYRMVVSEQVLYGVAGGANQNYNKFRYDATGPIFYQNNQWTHDAIGSKAGLVGSLDMTDVAVDNIRHKVYYASLQGGLVELDLTTGSYTNYNSSNSILQPSVGLTKLSALCIDGSGNVWMSNSYSSKSLVVKTPDNQWASFYVPNDIEAVRSMIADNYGQIWMGGKGNNMVVYNPGQNITDGADDQFKTLTTAHGSGALPDNNVWSIVNDKNGDIWVGTDVGIATFYCSGSVFSTNSCDADLIKVSRDGYIGYLFSTEIVQAIAVDGANRKWIGTTNGLWLISEDGKTELLKFTQDNSPLPSNSVVDIAVNQQTGEVFISTEKGLVSYEGDAILGGTTASSALVYPNPVKANYTGSIAIKGLVDNAYVKITDAGGVLVYQGKANGGQMIWDGKGYNGVRVNTGVYIVYASTDLGNEHNVAKIIFVN